MKNLKVWQKLGLFGVVFAIPLAVLTWNLLVTRAQRELALAGRERAGVAIYGELLGLQRELQHHRDLGHGFANGEATLAEPFYRSPKVVDVALRKVGVAVEQAAIRVDVRIRWRPIELDVQQTLARTNFTSTAEAYTARTRLIREVNDLILFIGDLASLNKDPGVDSYYLMEALQYKGPELAEFLSQARAMGTGMAARRDPPGTASQQLELDLLRQIARRIDAQIEGTEPSLLTSLRKATEFNPELEPSLATTRDETIVAAKQANAALRQLALEGRGTLSAAEFHHTLTRAISSLHQLEHRIAIAFTGLLQTRVAGIWWEVARTVSWVLLSFLPATLFGLVIMRDITRPLTQVVGIADRIASGDLTVNLGAEARQDELGGLIRTFNGMVKSLTAIVGQVQESGLQVNTSVNQISATSQEQQATAREIAATTTGIGATAREISATSRELVAMMNDASAVADDTKQLAGQGQEGLARMSGTMSQILDAADLVNTKLAVLKEKAANVNQVVTTITKIADRTNLLSLNAAIEADKAGEHGRGFAVVATEIRRLADQTAGATNDIEQMVKEMQSAMSSGVLGMNQFSEELRMGVADVQQVSAQLAQIIRQVQALTPRFESVNQSMRTQAAGGQQISDALAQLGRAVLQTVQSLEHSNLAIEQLKSTAYSLREGVARFRLPD